MQLERFISSMMRGVLVLVALVSHVNAQGIFWAQVDTHRIQWAEGGGSQIQTVVANKLDGEAEIVIDSAGGKIYWADNQGAAIRRANLDGSNFEELVAQNVRSIAICVDAGQLFWSDWHAGQIKRANLDGSQVEVIVPDATSTFGAVQHVAVDCVQGKLYWTEFTSNQGSTIRRANLDGSGEQIIYSVSHDVGRPYQIRVAQSLAKIYWADWENDGIFRANLDGSNVIQLTTTPGGTVRGFSLDEVRNKMYWLVQVESNPFPASLWQSDLDGNGVQQLPINLENRTRYNGLAVNPSSGDLYWNTRDFFEQNLGRMERVNIATLQRISLLSQSFGDIGGLALDPRPGGKIYYVDLRYYDIRSSNLDGSGSAAIFSGSSLPALAFDTNRNQLYFGVGNCDDLVGSINRINPDGSGNTTIIEPLYCPAHVEYDSQHDKLYWTEAYPLRIQRADPDAPGFRETVVVSPEGGFSGGLALDVQVGKIYWVVVSAGFDSKIHRSNLDGSQVEEIANSTHEIGGIAVDSQAGKIFWTEHDSIRVANLDGSDVQDFRIDPVEPRLLGDVIVDPRPLFCTRTSLYADITGLPASVDFGDISAVVDAFRGVESVSPGSLCDLYPCDPLGNRCLGDGIIDFRDVSQAVDAFKGFDCS